MENKENARSGGNGTGAQRTDAEMMHKDSSIPQIPQGANLEQLPITDWQAKRGFPDAIFDNLPDLLKNACAILTEQTEREVFLIGAIGVASGLLPNVRGFYDGQHTGCNLYCYVLGQYGTGKGGLKLAYQLGKAVHTRRKEISAELQAKFKQDCIEAKENKEPEPENPGSKLLFIPANNSKSGFVELLHENEGRGILFETEGDTLADALNTDYGGFSDVLRKAFHHERISFYRRTKREHREIEIPGLSVVLSSTIDQYQKLIPNIQNGLFSRFIHYNLAPCHDFKDVFDRRKRNYPEYFEKLGQTFLDIYTYLDALPAPIEFELREHQKAQFLAAFDEWKKEIGEYVSTNLEGTVNRLGLICFRLAMQFTALRNFGEGDYSPNMICTDTDFETSLQMVEVLKRHALEVYYDLPSLKVSKETADFQKNLAEKTGNIILCQTLSRQGIKPLEIAKRTGIPKTTVYRYLNNLK